MSVSMTFYSNFSKRENSTKQPTGGTSYAVVFKDAFSIIGGTVKLQVNFDTAKNYTAAKYGNNYYKVVDVVSTTNNIVEISLALDVLATYKADIAKYTSMIERSPSDANIVNIADNAIAPLPGYIINNVGTSLVSSIDPVVQLITQNDKGVFAYLLDKASYQEFCFLLDWEVGSKGADYITSSKICYLDISSIGNEAHSITVGKYDIHPVNGYSGVVRQINQPTLLTIRDELNTSNVKSIYNSAGSAYTDERRYNENYVELYLNINNQVTALDTNYLRGDKFIFEATIDPVSLGCMITTSIEKGSISTVINSTSTNIGVSFSFVSSANGFDALSAAVGNIPKPSGIAAPLNDAGYMATFGGLKKADKAKFIIAGDAGMYNNIYMAKARFVVSGTKKGMEINTASGPSGSMIAGKGYGSIDLITLVHPSIPKNPDELGYPYMGIANINTVGMTGFYKFAAPQLSLSAINDVKASVNEYLANGFFYE